MLNNSLLGKLPFLAVCACAAVSTSSAQDAKRVGIPQPGIVVVQFEPGVAVQDGASVTGLAAFDRIATRYRPHTLSQVAPFLDHLKPEPGIVHSLAALRRTFYLRYASDEDPYRVAAWLGRAAGVAYAEPLFMHRIDALQADPNDSLFSEQTHLRHMRMPQAWDIVKGAEGNPPVVIAIVDGGTDWRHEDLLGNVWTNSGEIADNGIDDDQNGFIDDVHGVNLANEDDTNNDPAGLPTTPFNAWHGTAVAGAAGAVTDNGIGIAGASWNAKLMLINAGCRFFDGGICWGYPGILYAAANGADIINASWRGFGTGAYGRDVVTAATDLGALVVAAGGNDNLSLMDYPSHPGGLPRVLAVGATEKDSRRKARFSNYGTPIDVYAPGVAIDMTAPDGTYGPGNGTSFSSPLVAGLAALVKTRSPSLTPDQLREQVRLTSESIDDDNPGFPAGALGGGYVNAEAALGVPQYPAVRLKRWTWTVSGNDGAINSGETVTLEATFINYLAGATGLQIALQPQDGQYLAVSPVEHSIGGLASGDSITVAFSIDVAPNAPSNYLAFIHTRIRDGAFEDSPDFLYLSLNQDARELQEGLLTLYDATDGANWLRNHNWDALPVTDIEELDTWWGVTVVNGQVVRVSLQNNNLTGALPDNAWQKLRGLRRLALGGNDLTGPIPPELGQLAQLQGLSLSNNSLMGPVPPELGQLAQLQGLSLHNNSLTGSIPPELGQLAQLRGLFLSNNSLLTGPIPPELGQLAQLQWLSSHGNSLTGPIPPELGQLAQLQWLLLHDNSLTGPIPPELGQLAQLQWLYLSNNSLTGPIPPELGQLAQLRELALHNNSLTGSIPPELGQLAQLLWLYLYDNSLMGPIPPELGQLTQLQELALHNNSLTGSIPPELGQLAQLQWLYLYDNSLMGPIPPELGQLAQLRELALHNNSLTGFVPPELGQLAQLRELALHNNSLTGFVPPELGQLAQLRELALHNNSLTGFVPPELGQLAQLRELALHNNSLTGFVPPELGQLAQLRELALHNNSLTGFVPPELGQLAPLKSLQLHNNSLTGGLPLTLTNLTDLVHFHFGGQVLCAPLDTAFQAWLSTIPNTSGPTCSLTFDGAFVADQSYPRAQAISPLVLPEATGGVLPVAYALTPALPAGLVFDAATQTISGTPTVVTAATSYTYTATDVAGESASLAFAISVFSPTDVDRKEIPEVFALRGNYPNPFRGTTHITFNLPWHAKVSVAVTDILGRAVVSVPPKDLAAGWERSVRLDGARLPSGMYFYRVQALSAAGSSVVAGRLVVVN